MMCYPKYISTKIPNNQWMKDIPEEERSINVELACRQFLDLYSLLSEKALIYLVPPHPKLQDQVYATNFGVVLPHLNNVAILSKFRAEGRSGEEEIAGKLLKDLGYQVYRCPYYFEGEGELKWLHDNVYVGGYGIRGEEKALDWIADNFDANIIKVKEPDEYLYHIDCCIFPLSQDIAIVYENIGEDALKQIEKEVDVIRINKELAYAGITNSFRIEYTLFNTNNSNAYPKDSDEYKQELLKNEMLKQICEQYGLYPIFVELTEFLKSGALLSCLIMHLTYDKIYLK